MNHRQRTALAATVALGASLLMTACEGGNTSSAPTGSSSGVAAASGSSATSGQAGTSAPGSAGNSGSGGSASSGGKTAGSGSSDSSGTDSSGTDSSGTDGVDTAGDKTGYGQECGTNDISWSATTETQAGGYFLIKAMAKPGITCVIPARLPVVAFGSDGTRAEPAEQSAGRPITLKAGAAAYAAVNPKTTHNNNGVEYQDLIVSVAQDDPNPESLNVGSFVADKPVVSSWHTSAAESYAIFTN
ncbi:DUF4232 domain-containing protein [Streptomyces sp. NPDC056161]|uniref:DUF4232 domain-containing protein n=1 Tax=Streptomyces sp. NPDC056161 TaxID=3345732 RepID=UPI0035DDD8D2